MLDQKMEKGMYVLFWDHFLRGRLTFAQPDDAKSFSFELDAGEAAPFPLSGF